jgi:hypothetical protein
LAALGLVVRVAWTRGVGFSRGREETEESSSAWVGVRGVVFAGDRGVAALGWAGCGLTAP